jgi:two-component system nitrogen regulation response regulator NtrX
MNEKHKILIIDDEAPIRQTLAASLMDEGFEVFSAKDGESGLEAIKNFQPEIILLDIWMPGKLDGMGVLAEGRKTYVQSDFVMMSGHGTIETAVKATKLGAWDFIEKPLSTDKIIVTLQNLISFRQEREDKAALLNKLRRNIAIIGESEPMCNIKQTLAQIAPADSFVFIEGENGTGKALVAQNIHYLSPRAGHPYIDISCKTIPPSLMESEFFGFEKGAFPGAEKTRRGKLELAHTGTIFIDDIQEMPLEIQDKLFSFINNGYFQRMGGSEKTEVKTRIIAASNLKMSKEISGGRFREILFGKLNTHLIKLPQLKERFGDIPALISHFSDMMVREGAFERKTFSAKAYEKMQEYQWPGNVRELKNFIERIYILTPGDYVDVHDLNFAGLVVNELNIDSASDSKTKVSGFNTFRDARAKFEKEFLLQKLNENNGNITRTAEIIGLERSYLHRKIKSYGINVDNN